MSAQAPRFLHGTVVAKADSQPLAVAAVMEENSKNIVFTDENGFFTIVLEGENPRIKVEFLGLESIEMAVGATDYLTIELPNSAVKKKRRERKKSPFSY